MWRAKENENIGLIAGSGQFPILFAQAASALNKKITVFGIEGYIDSKISGFVSEVHTVDLGTLGRLVELLKQSGIKKVVLAGSIPKKQIYNPALRLDETASQFMRSSANKGDDHLLRAFQVFLKVRCGISVIDPRIFLKHTLAPKGVLTRRAPSESEWADLRFGRKIAKGIGHMDIGQTVVIKEGVVLAVEAIEGTNEAVRRGGELSGGNAVIVKVAKPNQSLRFDLPCVGLETLEALKGASSRVLGIEAGKTIMILKEQLIERADQEGMTLVGLS